MLGLFRREKKNETKCKECGLELHDPERLKRHMKKAHGNVPEKKQDPKGSEGGGGCGKMVEWNDSKKYGAIFGGAFVLAGLIMATLVFPFWNLIREDIYEETVILANDDGICYVDAEDLVPKIIENCTAQPGTKVTIKFGEGLAWAKIVSP